VDDHVYQSSLFWSLLSRVSDITYFFGPWLVLIGTLVWAARLRTWPGILALAGGVLIAGGHLAHSAVPMVRTVSVGGQQPLVGENPVVVFFYLYGMSIGAFTLGIAIIAQFLRKRAVV
jgi:hypothetical protein